MSWIILSTVSPQRRPQQGRRKNICRRRSSSKQKFFTDDSPVLIVRARPMQCGFAVSVACVWSRRSSCLSFCRWFRSIDWVEQVLLFPGYTCYWWWYFSPSSASVQCFLFFGIEWITTNFFRRCLRLRRIPSSIEAEFKPQKTLFVLSTSSSSSLLSPRSLSEVVLWKGSKTKEAPVNKERFPSNND